MTAPESCSRRGITESRSEETDDSRARYTDAVEVGAGLLTPAFWVLAHLLYRYRQYRWGRLVRNGYDYSR